ncbi:MAG TPA: aspartate--tRNA ligase, partial [Planctomycetaceae bacterium]|nr:aspartate--tRNA ligase [Planctomycetaceae bacterium]
MLRTHTCGELRADAVGQEVTLCGWVDTTRDHGGAVFVDLRDRYGKTQVVAAPESGADVVEAFKKLHSEDVIQVRGKVAHRPQGTVNPKLATGEIELRVTEVRTLNQCTSPPFTPTQIDLPSEDLRLRYRYLDLRRPTMQQTLLLRSRIIKTMRDYFAEHD